VAYTQDDIDRLKAAIAQGIRRVRSSSGREIEYQSVADMERAIAAMERELAEEPLPNYRVASFSKGLDE
jgi:hypothetical protein